MKDISTWKRIGLYFLFAVAVTVLLFFLTPGYFIDEAVADILLIVFVAIIEHRKKSKK